MADRIVLIFDGDYKGLVSAVSNSIKSINGFEKASTAALKKVDGAVDKVSSAVTSKLSGIFSVGALVGFGRAVISVTSDFEKYNAVLGNTLSSTALAGLKIKEIQDFAARTPYSVNELTASFVKLANGGFKPTGDQMTRLGDLAASTGKSFDQLAEAILDAQTGEFERLKEFGIRAKDAGDSVIFTYKGVQTQVEKTSGAIREYITNIGGAIGVSGSMEKISKTLGGQISNLGDNWDSFLLSFGNNTTGAFNKAINGLNTLLNGITRFNNQLNVASKFNLDYKDGAFTTEIGREINRAINPFADKGATKQELAVYEINEATKNVSDLVSRATAGAKSVADFGKALAQLKKQADAALSSPTVGQKGDPLTKKVREAIKAEYQVGILAIQDARRNFIADLTKPDGNFGKAGKGTAEGLADVYKDLSIALKQNNLEFGATFNEKRIKDVEAYQEAIKGLIANGIKPASAEVAKFVKEQERLSKLIAGGSLADVTGKVKAADVTGRLNFKVAKVDFSKAKTTLPPPDTSEFDNAVKNSIYYASQNIISSLNNIGEQGSSVFANLGNSIVHVFDDIFANQISNALTELGTTGSTSIKGIEFALVAMAGSIISGLGVPGKKGNVALKTVGGALSGAAAGALAGSVVPGLGTALGAVVGGVLGGVSGLLTGSKQQKQAEIQKKQLEEAEKQTRLLERQNALAYTAQIIGRMTNQGIVTGVEVNEFGDLTTKIAGQDLEIILKRANRSRQRGT